MGRLSIIVAPIVCIALIAICLWAAAAVIEMFRFLYWMFKQVRTK